VAIISDNATRIRHCKEQAEQIWWLFRWGTLIQAAQKWEFSPDTKVRQVNPHH